MRACVPCVRVVFTFSLAWQSNLVVGVVLLLVGLGIIRFVFKPILTRMLARSHLESTIASL